MSDRIRVLVADDSAVIRRAVLRMLADAPDIEVVGQAIDGAEAIALTKELRPDVVVLDVHMPGMNGLDAVRSIMREAPTGVLMLTTPTRSAVGTTLSALELGAVDFLTKATVGSVLDIHSLGPQLREKIIAVAGAAVRAPLANDPAPPGTRVEAVPGETVATLEAVEPRTPGRRRGRPRRPPTDPPYDVVVIGASTGGPRALAAVVSDLPEGFGAGIVVAQHMPARFTRTLADRLHRRSALEVVEACDGDEVRPGRVLITPGGTHSAIVREGGRVLVQLDAGLPELIHRPSIDRLFRSAAETCGPRVVGVVLTGMGDDGALGLATLRDAGARTIAESEDTAVIFGMPRAAGRVAERVLPLHEIGACLASLCTAQKSAGPARHPD
jgi:two-component system chemotaxis response regulator CheB